MSIWFTSDNHFGHKRIIELANRPFSSLNEMDECMIVRWNDRVKPGDIVYHVGDFAFTDHDPYLERLSGQKFLVPGNLDHSNRVKKATGWVKVERIMDVILPDGTMVVLCHYAMRVWSRSHHGAIHLYGHPQGLLERAAGRRSSRQTSRSRLMVGLEIKRLDGESWRDCARRLGRKYGLEAEVMVAFEKNLKARDSETTAALEACYEWDLCELVP
jgi:calcineurin-like phosphoesterase family protein